MEKNNKKCAFLIDENDINIGLFKKITTDYGLTPIILSYDPDDINKISEKESSFLFINMDKKNVALEKLLLSVTKNPSIKIYGLSNQHEPPSHKLIIDYLRIPLNNESFQKIFPKNEQHLDILETKVLQSIKDLAGEEDPHFLPSLIELFFGRAPILINEIKEAINSHNYDKLEHSAHSLKGSCGNLGAYSMMEICGQLEENGRNKTIHCSQELLDNLSSTYKLVEHELKKHWMPLAS